MPFRERPRNFDSEDRGPLLKKIEAQLADLGKPWAYADGCAKKICKKDRIEFCTPDELGKIVAALA